MTSSYNPPSNTSCDLHRHDEAAGVYATACNDLVPLIDRFSALYQLEIMLTSFDLDDLPLTQEVIDNLRHTLTHQSRRRSRITDVISDIGDYIDPVTTCS
jgi:hypothetical protein